MTLAGGDEQALSVALEPQPEEKTTIVMREREIVDDSATTWMIAGWVTTGALVAGAIITGIMGSSEADELEQLRGGLSSEYDAGAPTSTPGAALATRMDETKSNAETLLLASDVMSGAALIVGGLSLWITLDPWEPERTTAPAPAPSAQARDALQVGYADGRLQLRGSF